MNALPHPSAQATPLEQIVEIARDVNAEGMSVEEQANVAVTLFLESHLL